MSYFIRREVDYSTGEHAVTFWRGASDPFVWVFHPSDAAKFDTASAAQTAFTRATGRETGCYHRERITTVGGPPETIDPSSAAGSIPDLPDR